MNLMTGLSYTGSPVFFYTLDHLPVAVLNFLHGTRGDFRLYRAAFSAWDTSANFEGRESGACADYFGQGWGKV